MSQKKIRIIPRLDIKGKNLIKSIQFEGLKVIGSPNEFALKYYDDGADEIILIDCVASLYNRDNLKSIIQEAAKNIFVPITVGGGIRNLEDATNLLTVGADKIAVNTAVIKNPELIKELANKLGSQCVVLSIEAKRTEQNNWEAFMNYGRDHTGFNVLDWAKKGTDLGAGEILLTSVDKEGTRKGFDVDLIKSVSNKIDTPIIVSGGMGKLEDIEEISNIGNIHGISMADILHHGRSSVNEIKKFSKKVGFTVRENL